MFNQFPKAPYRAQGFNNFQPMQAQFMQGAPIKKHSGAKHKIAKNGKPVTFGWHYNGRSKEMTKYFAAPYKDSHEVKSKSGRCWLTVILTVTPQNAAPFIRPALMDLQTGKVICQDLGIVMNPKTASGLGVIARIGAKPRQIFR